MQNNRKRLLFVLSTGDIGGTRTALANLITNMDRQRYDIEVLLILRRGPMVSRFENLCTTLSQNRIIKAGRDSVSTLVKSFDLIGLIRRIWLSVGAKLKKSSRHDYAYRLAAKQYGDKYDCVIAFQEGETSEFAQYISAPKKIAWIHTEFSRAVRGRGETRLSEVSNRFDSVVFVSKACMDEFKEKSHIEQDKMLYIHNTFDIDDIINRSTEYTVDREGDLPILVSVGRFCGEKSFHRAVRAALRLKNEGYRFKWYIIGDGELFDEIEAEVLEKSVDDCVVLTGRKNNPYPYILSADAMVLTSVVESHPMVATESLTLETPIVSTAFSSATESVVDGYNGILCDNSSEGVYQGVKRILDDSALLERLKENVVGFKYDNLSIVKQVEALID